MQKKCARILIAKWIIFITNSHIQIKITLGSIGVYKNSVMKCTFAQVIAIPLLKFQNQCQFGDRDTNESAIMSQSLRHFFFYNYLTCELRPRPNFCRCHFRFIFVNVNSYIYIKHFLKLVHNKPALVQTMAWCREATRLSNMNHCRNVCVHQWRRLYLSEKYCWLDVKP